MNKNILFAVLCTGLLFAVGCELVDPSTSSTASEGGNTSETATNNNNNSNGFDFGSVTWLGPAYPGTTRDERVTLYSASIDRGANRITLSYDPLPSDWPLQVNAPGQLVMFEQLGDGSWRGGRVEWLDPGQSVKSLNNISNGYNGWRLPPAGARMAIVILSKDGIRCSNVVYTNY